MSTVTAPRTPSRPKLPSRPVSTVQQETRTHKEENARRVRDAYRTYQFARYEWLRLKAVGLGYLTPSNYVPLPLKDTETLASIQAKSKALLSWLKANEALDEEASQPEPEEAPIVREPKTWPIPPKAPRVPCRGCGALMVFAPTEGGKVAPLNLDGTSHFATCPNADNFQYNKASKAQKESAMPSTTTQTQVPAHVREIHDLATRKGLSHDRGHRTARLAATNVFLMQNEREPIDSWRDIRLEDAPLLKEGLERGLLTWS